jgi:phosphoenolpyruvate carboxylase
MERDWPFFSSLLANAEMACAKADLRIARRYVELWDDEEPRERIWDAIRTEFDRTVHELLLVCEEERLLERSPVLRASIDRRNPYVDPLSSCRSSSCAGCATRARAPPARTAPRPSGWARVTLTTLNGIAGGLRNTG